MSAHVHAPAFAPEQLSSPTGYMRTYAPLADGGAYIVAGGAGYLRADCVRLPSGHPHVDAWVMRSDTGESDALVRRLTQPLAAAWDRGGGSALFAALEALYPEVLS